MNKKQRLAIYRKVLAMLEGEHIGCLPETKKDWCVHRAGICELLHIAPMDTWDGTYTTPFDKHLENFPEFLLFKPVQNEDLWFWWIQSDRDARKNAIAFCVAMTKK